MPLTSLQEVLKEADAGKYAVGAFNCNNMEIVQAIIRAAEAENSPVIIQASQGAIKYAGLDYVTALIRVAATGARVPVVMHLDHGTDFDQVMACIEAGFTSVMFDGSARPVEENMAITRRVVEVAHAAGVSVEAELGRIRGTEDHIAVSEREAFFTDPGEAAAFVAATGVDALAVAIGTAHGPYKGEPQLDFDRLQAIDAVVDIPLVLHGSSGVPAAMVQRAIVLGVRKINIDTDIRQTFGRAVREILAARPDEIDPRKILGPARDAMQKTVQEKMQIFGCAGRA